MFDYFTDPANNIGMDILDVFVRALVSILVLFLLAKILGNKQISQLSFFDYVVGISIGSIAAEMATNTDTPHHFFLIGMVTYVLVSLLFGFISLKSVKARRFIDGKPIVLIENGNILYEKLKEAQMTVDSLLAECRYAGYFDVADINVAILETSGEVSILPKPEAKQVTVEDMGLQIEEELPKANVIIDGAIIENNLRAVGKNMKWLIDKLDEKELQAEKILLATLDKNGEFTVFKRDTVPQKYDKFE